jgi:hypothetical protein
MDCFGSRCLGTDVRDGRGEYGVRSVESRLCRVAAQYLADARRHEASGERRQLAPGRFSLICGGGSSALIRKLTDQVLAVRLGEVA